MRRMMLKRVLSAVLAAVMVLSMVPAMSMVAGAAEEKVVTGSTATPGAAEKLLYYENDFETGNLNELVLQNGPEIIEAEGGNHVLHMPKAPTGETKVMWNYNQKWDLGPYTVFEMDIRTSDVGTLQIYANGENQSFRPFVIRKTGVISPAHNATTQKLLAHLL